MENIVVSPWWVVHIPWENKNYRGPDSHIGVEHDSIFTVKFRRPFLLPSINTKAGNERLLEPDLVQQKQIQAKWIIYRDFVREWQIDEDWWTTIRLVVGVGQKNLWCKVPNLPLARHAANFNNTREE
jgi:hypothetical protein